MHVIYVRADVYIYIYILGISARFARAEAYAMILRDHMTGLCDGIILRYDITG